MGKDVYNWTGHQTMCREIQFIQALQFDENEHSQPDSRINQNSKELLVTLDNIVFMYKLSKL